MATRVDGVLGNSCAKRDELVASVLAEPKSPDAWWALLSHAEHLIRATPAEGQPNPEHGAFELFELYKAAICVPREGNLDNPSFFAIWLGYAKHRWW